MSESKKKTRWIDPRNTTQKRIDDLKAQLHEIDMELYPLKRKIREIFNSSNWSILVYLLLRKYIEFIIKKTCLEIELKATQGS